MAWAWTRHIALEEGLPGPGPAAYDAHAYRYRSYAYGCEPVALQLLRSALIARAALRDLVAGACTRVHTPRPERRARHTVGNDAAMPVAVAMAVQMASAAAAGVCGVLRDDGDGGSVRVRRQCERF